MVRGGDGAVSRPDPTPEVSCKSVLFGAQFSCIFLLFKVYTVLSLKRGVSL